MENNLNNKINNLANDAMHKLDDLDKELNSVPDKKNILFSKIKMIANDSRRDLLDFHNHGNRRYNAVYDYDRADYETNAKSYYDYLARLNYLLDMLLDLVNLLLEYMHAPAALNVLNSKLHFNNKDYDLLVATADGEDNQSFHLNEQGLLDLLNDFKKYVDDGDANLQNQINNILNQINNILNEINKIWNILNSFKGGAINNVVDVWTGNKDLHKTDNNPITINNLDSYESLIVYFQLGTSITFVNIPRVNGKWSNGNNTPIHDMGINYQSAKNGNLNFWNSEADVYVRFSGNKLSLYSPFVNIYGNQNGDKNVVFENTDIDEYRNNLSEIIDKTIKITKIQGVQEIKIGL